MKKIIALLLGILLIAALAACQTTEKETASPDTSAEATQAATQAQTEAVKETAAAQDNTAKLVQPAEVVTTANVTSNGAIDASSIFSDRDLRQTYDLTDAVYYDLSSGQDISITKEGVYVISGSAENASVIVDAGDNDKIQLVLNGVTVTNSSTPAIYVKNADKVFVTTVENTTSALTVSGTFTAEGDTNTDAVIFSKDDIVLNGLGTLNINSSDNGISGKDDIKITGGTLNITCTSDAIEANESIAVADGTVTIKSGKDGLHSENDEDNTTGYIYICGGTFDINASSDGVQGTTVVQIDGGSVTTSSSEGVEATFVQINGGTVRITAADDGINASTKSGSYTPTVEINGGDLTIDMGQGDTDGIDANGSIYINGGTVNINANSPFDYDSEGKLNGGTVYVNGSQVTELENQFGGGMGGPGGMNQPGGGGNMRAPGGF